jgi:hypothetical protein
MRIWTIHAKYLDSKGLVAAWREGLLAQKVLEEKTIGYKKHPQLTRFRASPNGVDLIRRYLKELMAEARKRGFHFNEDKIGIINTNQEVKIIVTNRQLAYEYELLKMKLKKRDPKKYIELLANSSIMNNAVFSIVIGEIEKWEKVKNEVLALMKTK